MTNRGLNSLAIKLAAVLVLGGAAVGCSIEPGASGQPTYEADVRPIFMARCIRCHGSPPLADPTSKTYPGPPVSTVRFDVFGDTNCDADGGGTDCVRGAAHEAMTGAFKTFVPLMPPDPAPPLTSYQRDTILNWAKESPPLE
jgi:hypothetical protein